jgi:ribonuclease HII
LKVKTKMIVCGIDEAGRGPVIGPMVMGCAVFDEVGGDKLRELKVRDSKKVAPSRRLSLEPLIKEYAVEWGLIKVYPQEIDLRRKKTSLNMIEALKIAELISSLESNPDKIIVDSADSIAENFRGKITGFLNKKGVSIPEIISEHKADDRYIEVSAASILAKVERDREIEILKSKYGELGSGYPSDEVTQGFIKNLVRNGELPDYVRKSWNTVNRKKQTSLSEF